MTDVSDPDRLARRYLDLWQDQVTALVNDPAVADVVARTYAMMTRGAQAAAKAAGMPAAAPQTERDERSAGPVRNDQPAPAGAPATASASRGSGDDFDRLAARLAELEERVVRLEAALGASGGATQTRTRKRRS